MDNGLDDVVAAETALSDVDGAAGRLLIRGHSLDELVGVVRYEDVLEMLFSGLFAAPPSPDGLALALGQARAQVFSRLAASAAPLDLPATEAVRALIAQIEDGDGLDAALQLVAAPAVFAPAIIRMKRGAAPVAPDPASGHAADVLHMLRGEPIVRDEAEALDAYFVVVSDHGLNASTFAARVVASTHAGLTS